MLLLPLLRAPLDRPRLRSGRQSRSVKASVRRGKGSVGPAGRGVGASVLARCWSFSVAGGPIMIMRMTWGKLRAGTWNEYEQAYNGSSLPILEKNK